ncbi:WD repeat-containing protein 36 [Vespula maculifrons]|uniref:WD repeat-containing protein 36 n=1 Tax=Vespula maculifrons TaxID=7453 RepID=A0ABD2BZ72_VESMC
MRYSCGHKEQLINAAFDTRWLIISSMGYTIKDVFQVSDACISLHFASTGELFTTAHMCSRII